MPNDGTGNDTPKDGQENELILGKYKTVEDLEKAYKTLEREYHAAKADYKQAEQFAQMVAPNFRVDEEAGTVSWNEDYLTEVMKALGYRVEKSSNSEPDSDSDTDNDKDNDMNKLDKNMLGELIKKEVQKMISPVAKTVNEMTTKEMLSEMENKFPDFKDYQKDIGLEMKKRGIVVNNVKDLESLYWAVKGSKGDLFDRKTAEAEAKALHDMLMKTGSFNLRSVNASNKEPQEITGDTLLGIDSNASKTDEAKAAQHFTGSPAHLLKK